MGPSLVLDPEAEEHRLESLLVAGGVSDATRSAVLPQLAAQDPPSPGVGKMVPASGKAINPARVAALVEKQDQLLAGLLLGSPEFQRR